MPPLSILAEPTVSVVDKNVDKHGTRDVAEAYSSSSTSDEGQEIARQAHYRPQNAGGAGQARERLPQD